MSDKLYRVRPGLTFFDNHTLHREGALVRWHEGSAALEEVDEATGESVSIATAADFNGADPAAFDHDGDGKPGGSKKRTTASA